MKKISKLIVLTILTFSFSLGKTIKIYSWTSENGSTVLSDTQPPEGIFYKILNISRPSVVDIKILQQSKIKKLNNSKLTKKNKTILKTNQEIFEIKIISPSNDANIFTKKNQIAIKTNPALLANDKPIFIINDNNLLAIFENGFWYILRPSPGKNQISISGKTADDKNIKSINSPIFYIKNGWLQQYKNTKVDK